MHPDNILILAGVIATPAFFVLAAYTVAAASGSTVRMPSTRSTCVCRDWGVIGPLR